MMETTLDDFLGGRLQIEQPKFGYRAGTDPVFLAASIPAVPGQSILELGCGVGTAMLCLGTRIPDLRITGVELQADYAELARSNAQKNGIAADVINCDLSQMPVDLRQKTFDHVIANPPYFDRARGTSASDEGRETALGEGLALEKWVEIAAKRLAPRGYATFICRVERLPELIAAFGQYLGSIQVFPLIPRMGRDAHLILIRGRKGGRADFRLHAPVQLHQGQVHEQGSEDATEIIRQVQRFAGPLYFPD